MGRIAVRGHGRKQWTEGKLDYLIDLAAGFRAQAFARARSAAAAPYAALEDRRKREYGEPGPRRADGVELADDLPAPHVQVHLLARLAQGRVEQVRVGRLGLAAGERYLAGVHAEALALAGHQHGRLGAAAPPCADRDQDRGRAQPRPRPRLGRVRRSCRRSRRRACAACRRIDRRREPLPNRANVHGAAPGAGRYYALAIKGFNGGGRGVGVAIGYEVNPPRLPEEAGRAGAGEQERLLAPVARRVADLGDRCDFVHVTESVMGTRRVPPIAAARCIMARVHGLPVTVTMRTRERSESEAVEFAAEARGAGIGGILIVMGDPPREGGRPGAGAAAEAAGRPVLAPSRAARSLRDAAGARGPDLFLSVPAGAGAARPDAGPMRAKIDAGPAGFFTQVVSSVREAADISSLLGPMGFRVVPIVIVPSAANKRSAAALGLDWSGYEGDPAGFIRAVHNAAGDVLVTSPSDFSAARDALGCV